MFLSASKGERAAMIIGKLRTEFVRQCRGCRAVRLSDQRPCRLMLLRCFCRIGRFDFPCLERVRKIFQVGFGRVLAPNSSGVFVSLRLLPLSDGQVFQPGEIRGPTALLPIPNKIPVRHRHFFRPDPSKQPARNNRSRAHHRRSR